jgi:ribosomal protein L39E
MLSIQIQEASRIPNRLNQNRTFPQHIIIKTTTTGNRERILKFIRVKKQLTYKGKPIEIMHKRVEEVLPGNWVGSGPTNVYI